ncbi:MAG: hypothetical protein N3F66_07020 [Spirochaetes bacterium]|nr:hypothetical protein [Spirochaetota bacterium]
MKNIFHIAIIITGIAFLHGCVTPMGMTSSSTPLHNKVIIENLGQAQGSDWSWSLFGLWSVGRPDMDNAINEAIASKNGDALINVRWYQKHYYFVLFSVTKVIVTGQVIKTAPATLNEPPKKR